MFSFFKRDTPQPDQQQQQQQQQPKPAQPQESEIKLINPQTKYKLLFGGLTFFAFSFWMTRRALNKRYLASIPPFYTSSLYHKPKVNGGADAFEALNLATLNVLSLGMAGTGGVMCALDVNGIEDMRAFVRKGFYGDGGGLSEADEELERSVEEWVGNVLGEKFGVELKREKELSRKD
ncbi:hypothetical protein BDV25DRAFT_172742 [Aspergillus avenaceus]|uniref:Altered inheritance of mitochondria protein 11 n=1 Tax=Aspergillus avenaceus TaxID=36643 RepID=A0A5N6TT54_ASPAV|nr:hypothetical protein BDV25DRAFT_172742 [Aspergillus avenaceus]